MDYVTEAQDTILFQSKHLSEWEIRYINDDLQFVKKNFEKFQKLLLKKYKEDIAEITIENIPICVVPGLIEKNQKKIITLMNKFNIFRK